MKIWNNNKHLLYDNKIQNLTNQYYHYINLIQFEKYNMNRILAKTFFFYFQNTTEHFEIQILNELFSVNDVLYIANPRNTKLKKIKYNQM